MTLTRKEFFRQGFYSLGEALFNVRETVRESLDSTVVNHAHDREPVPDENMVAIVDNQHCLAGGCGCFCCIDRCESGAVSVIMGEGIRIDADLCTGCGICEYVCPVNPKAITMVKRKIK